MTLDLGKEIGPLPLGAWIAVIAGGVGIAVWSRNSTSGSANDVTIAADTGSPAGVGDGTVGGWDPTNPPAPTDGTPAITTNEQWGNQAINWLVAQGYEPAWCYSAITKALSGGTGDNALSAREYVLWGLALAKFGAPPLPVNVPPPGAITPPVQDPGPAPAPTPGPGPAPPPPPDNLPQPPPGMPRHKFDGAHGTETRCQKVWNGQKCLLVQNRSIHFDSIWTGSLDSSAHSSAVRTAPVAQRGIAQSAQAVPSVNRIRYASVTPSPLPGSSLKSLAQINYGDGGQWHRIFEANRAGSRRADGTPGLIENPNHLRAGWRLIIPT